MTDASAAIAGFFGIVAVLFGLFSDDFYPSMMGPAAKKLPKWFGRSWFFGFAAIMFGVALRHFLAKR
ncbi:MAG: hypothetical protein ABSH13_20210 [Candidatus Acidiferrum sp.]|jgi:hypothetical protein